MIIFFFILFSEGQAIFHRLSKQLKCVTKKIKKAIDLYNAIGGPCCSLPPNLSVDDVASLDSEIFNCLGQHQEISEVPPAMKQEIIQLKCLISRCQEEKELVKKEMISTLSWYDDQLRKLKKNLVECNSPGKASLLIREGMLIEMTISNHLKTFQQYIGESFSAVPLTLTENVLADDFNKMSEMLNYLASVEDLFVEVDSETESSMEDDSDSDSD